MFLNNPSYLGQPLNKCLSEKPLIKSFQTGIVLLNQNIKTGFINNPARSASVVLAFRGGGSV